MLGRKSIRAALVAASCLLLSVAAQNPAPASSSPSPASGGSRSIGANATSAAAFTLTTARTSTVTLAAGTPLPSGVQPLRSDATSLYLSVYNETLLVNSFATLGLSATPSLTSSSAAPSATANATADAIAAAQSAVAAGRLPLHTTIDPAFGVLGAWLIITGLFMAAWGVKSRVTTVFIAGSYATAIIVICVILKVGVIPAVFDPSAAIRGVYLVAAVLGGAVVGIVCMIFYSFATFLTAGLGGFAFGLFLQATRDGGLIRPVGLRFILYFGLFALAFAAHTVAKGQRIVLILSTSFVGATAVVLGVDCYTTGEQRRTSDFLAKAHLILPSTAGLKEFYIRNLGLDDLFVKKYPTIFGNDQWPLTTGQEVELGAIGLVFLIAVALQWRLWGDLKRSVEAIRAADEDRETRRRADRAAKSIFKSALSDLQAWESRHGKGAANARSAPAQTPTPAEKALETPLDETKLMFERQHSRSLSLLGYTPTTPGLDRPRSDFDMERGGSYSSYDNFNGRPMSIANAADLYSSPGGPSNGGSPSGFDSNGHERRQSSFFDYVQTGRGRDSSGYLSRWDPASRGRTHSAATLPALELGPSLAPLATSASAGIPRQVEHQALLSEIAEVKKSIDALRQAGAARTGSTGNTSSASSDKAIPPDALPSPPLQGTFGKSSLHGHEMERPPTHRYGSIASAKAATRASMTMVEDAGDDTITHMREKAHRMSRHSDADASGHGSYSRRAARLSSASMDSGIAPVQRQIQVDEELLQARRAAAMPVAKAEPTAWTALPHRQSSGSGSGSGSGSPAKPSSPVILPQQSSSRHLMPGPLSKRHSASSMTLAQFEARHQERLAAMQRMTNDKLQEREQAKAAREESLKAEAARARAEAAARAAPPPAATRPVKPQLSRPHSADMLSFPSASTTPAAATPPATAGPAAWPPAIQISADDADEPQRRSKRSSGPLTETDRRRIAEGALAHTRKRHSQPLLQFDNAVVEQAIVEAERLAQQQQQQLQRQQKRASSGSMMTLAEARPAGGAEKRSSYLG